jgi:hypothetical protein
VPSSAAVSGAGCGGRERLLKLLICRVAGVRAEGYLLFAGEVSHRIVAVGMQADRECNREAVQRVGDRREPDGNGERSALD